MPSAALGSRPSNVLATTGTPWSKRANMNTCLTYYHTKAMLPAPLAENGSFVASRNMVVVRDSVTPHVFRPSINMHYLSTHQSITVS